MREPNAKSKPDGRGGAGAAAPSAGFVDFHSHLVPGVDDGARDADESRAALEAMRSSGVAALVTTPHVRGSLPLQPEELATRMGDLDVGWTRLVAIRDEAVPDLDIRRGAEVLLDTPEPDLADPRLRLGGGAFVLVEFPYFTVPPRSTRVIGAIRGNGFVPIIAHPERYRDIASDIDVVDEWRNAGAYLQMNGPSLIGRYGPEARAAASLLLERGWVDYLSSDYHARGETGIAEYRDVLSRLGAEAQAEVLMRTNPVRMLNGDPPFPVPPLPPRRRLWQRIAAAFR